MERPQRLVIAALAGAAALLIVGWAVMVEPPNPTTAAAREAPAAGALDAAPAMAPNASTERTTAPVERSTAAEQQAPRGPNTLTVTVVDPLDLLARGNELCASGKGSLVCRQWRREGDLLTGTWPDEVEPPAVVEFILEPLRPSRFVAASAPLTPDPAGGWRARLDLTDAVAIVEFTVTGDYHREVHCTLRAGFTARGVRGMLDLSETLTEPLVVLAPVPCTIITELDDRGMQQYAQRTMFPIVTGGRHRYEVSAASGSVRVRVHQPNEPSNRALTSLLVELMPTLERGGFYVQRTTQTGYDDVAFTLVPPGRYELSCYEQQSFTRTLIGVRNLEVGVGETLVEFRSPADQRTVTVLHDAPAGTEFWLLRAGVGADVARGALASADAKPVRFEGLDAAEWIVWARGADGIAVAPADTRFQQDVLTELGGFQTLSAIQLQPTEKLAGSFLVRLTDASGREMRPPLDGRHPNIVPVTVLPGLLEVRVLHESGRIATASVLVPPGATPDAPFLIPLNFRYP